MVMNKDAWFIDKCANLKVGESATPVHRYQDGWWVLWEHPHHNNFGRILKTEPEFRRFMAGDYNLGQRIGQEFFLP